MNQQEQLAVLDKIAGFTTEIGAAIGEEGVTLQLISDEVDAILKKVSNANQAGDVVPQAVVDRLQVLSDASATISQNLAAHKGILTAILAKGGPVVPDTPALPQPTQIPGTPITPPVV